MEQKLTKCRKLTKTITCGINMISTLKIIVWISISQEDKLHACLILLEIGLDPHLTESQSSMATSKGYISFDRIETHREEVGWIGYWARLYEETVNLSL